MLTTTASSQLGGYMQSNSHKPWYEYTGPLVILAFICYLVYSFLKQPYALQSVALCFGVPLLILVVMVVIGAMPRRNYTMPILNDFNVPTVKRKNPDFDTKKAYASIKEGAMIGILSVIFLLPLGFTVFSTEFHGTISGIAVASLCASPMSLILGTVGIKSIWNGVSVLVKKRSWIQNAVATQAAIVDRRVVLEEHANEYGDIYGLVEYDIALDIAHQSTQDTGEQFIEARIGKRLYNKYQHSETIRVYYADDDPLTLMVKGE